MSAEAAIYDRLKNWLDERQKRYELFWFKVHGSAYQRAGIPDVMIFLNNGRTILIELKAPGEHPSAIQSITIQKLRNLKHCACWTDDFDHAVRMIEATEQLADWPVPVVNEGKPRTTATVHQWPCVKI